MHGEPARELGGGGPFPPPTDLENEGTEAVPPGPWFEPLDPGNEDLGQTGKTVRRFGGVACRVRVSGRLDPGSRRRRQRLFVAGLHGFFSPLRRARTMRPGVRGGGLRSPRSVGLRCHGRVEQAESGCAISAQDAGQTADAGEGRGNSRSALGQPAAESQHRSAQFPDFRRRAADLSVGPAQGPGASDDAPADPARCVSDPNRDPRRFFALDRDPVNPLASCGPVLPDVSVGRSNAGADPADPEPHAAEPRARFPDPGADGVEARWGLIERVWGRRFGLGVFGAQVENRQTEVTRLGGGGTDCRRNPVVEFKLSRCYRVSYARNVTSVFLRSLGRWRCRRAGAWGDTRVGGFEPGAIRESAGSS